MTPHVRTRLAAAGFDVRRVADLSRSGEAPVWRLDLADGRTVKLRRLPSMAVADLVWSVLQTSAGLSLPRPICRFGRTIVMEHVEGVPLDRYLRGRGRLVQHRMVRDVGRLAAALHRQPSSSASSRSAVEYHEFVVDVVQRLGRRGWLDPDVVSELTRLPLPAPVRFVPTHGDLCPENVIVERARRLRAVDEERLAERPAAFDIARTVTRWRLDASLERALLHAYDRAGGDSRHYRGNRALWIAVALSTSAVYRLYYRLPGLRPVVTGLRRLVT